MNTREPDGWAASAVVGLVLGATAAGVLLLLAGAAATTGRLGTLLVWVVLAPLATVVVMGAAGIAVRRLGRPVRRWWWTIALPPVLALVVAFGAFLGGPACRRSFR